MSYCALSVRTKVLNPEGKGGSVSLWAQAP